MGRLQRRLWKLKPVTTSVEQRNTCWNTILHIACITDVCFYCVFQASGGKREEDVERERHARRRTCLELLACFALAFARLQNCRLQDTALKTATSLALNLPWRRFCPCKAKCGLLIYSSGFSYRQKFFKKIVSCFKKGKYDDLRHTPEKKSSLPGDSLHSPTMLTPRRY